MLLGRLELLKQRLKQRRAESALPEALERMAEAYEALSRAEAQPRLGGFQMEWRVYVEPRAIGWEVVDWGLV